MMVGPIGKALSIIAGLIALAAFGGAIYGLFLLSWAAVAALGMGFIITGVIVTAIGVGESRHRHAEHAAIPGRLAAINAAYAPAVTGPVYTPEPMPVDIFTWVVRKQAEGRFDVFPMTRKGIELREHTVAAGIDSDEAWRIRNHEQRAIGK